MHKRLSPDKIKEILEVGIEEFATHGLDRANVNVIAKKSGVSVGVLYKYFEDKDKFFLECVRHSLKLMRTTFDEIIAEEKTLEEALRRLLVSILEIGRSHGNYYAMYNEITSGSCSKYADILAEEIESISAELYTQLFENGKRQGFIRKDMNPRLFAFFFDNLLMMLQFSTSCEYYKNRFFIFGGRQDYTDEELIDELVKFLKGALCARVNKEDIA